MIFLTLCLGHSGEKRRWLTWWWVGSAGGGGCWTDLVCPHIQWDSECLAETPVQDIFNFNLWQKSEGQHSEGGCGCSVWVNHVLNLRCWGWCTELCLAITRWWTHPPEVNWAVKLKRKSFFFFFNWLACGISESGSGYLQAKCGRVVSTLANRKKQNLKTLLWEQFIEAVEQNFWLA